MNILPQFLSFFLIFFALYIGSLSCTIRLTLSSLIEVFPGWNLTLLLYFLLCPKSFIPQKLQQFRLLKTCFSLLYLYHAVKSCMEKFIARYDVTCVKKFQFHLEAQKLVENQNLVSVSYWNIQQLMSTNFGYSGTTYNKVYNNRCPDLLRCNILIFPVNACSLISQTRVLRILQLNDNVSNCFPFTSEIACAGNSVDGLFFFGLALHGLTIGN